MSKLCLKDVYQMSRLYPIHVKHMSDTCLLHVYHMCNLCLTCQIHVSMLTPRRRFPTGMLSRAAARGTPRVGDSPLAVVPFVSFFMFFNFVNNMFFISKTTPSAGFDPDQGPLMAREDFKGATQLRAGCEMVGCAYRCPVCSQPVDSQLQHAGVCAPAERT